MGQFSYISAGKKDSNYTLLFIHGNGQSKENFEPLLKSPELSSFRSFALDLPGHGEVSPFPQEMGHSLSLLGAYVREFIESQELSNVILFGNSLGGHVCMRVAHQNPRVVGLMIWGTPPLKNHDSLASAFLPSEHSQLIFKENISEDEIRNFIRFSFSGESNYLELLFQSMVKCTPRFRSDIFQSIVAGDLIDETEILNQLKFRALILWGGDDVLANPRYFGKHLVDSNCNHVFYQVSGHGHFIHLEDVSLFSSIVLNYVQSMGLVDKSSIDYMAGI